MWKVISILIPIYPYCPIFLMPTNAQPVIILMSCALILLSLDLLINHCSPIVKVNLIILIVVLFICRWL